MQRLTAPLFLSAGIPRSGSTWLFNALRLLLKQRYSRVYSCWIDEFDTNTAQKADVALVKIHEANPELAARAEKIFTSHRDLRDIAISMKDVGVITSDEQWITWVDGARTQHEYWAQRACADLSYDDIVERPQDCIYRLSKLLFPNVYFFRQLKNWQTRRKLESLPFGDKKAVHHLETLLHHEHTKAGGKTRWRSRLPAKISNEITSKHRDWLIQMNYIPAETEGASADESIVNTASFTRSSEM